MKFILTFEGELPSRGKPKDQWAIRKQFYPQLQELWLIHPGLVSLRRNPFVPVNSGFFHVERHHSVDAPPKTSRPTISLGGTQPEAVLRPAHTIDLCEAVRRKNRTFLPLVRERLALKCGLKILFLRKEDAGRVYQGGDLDNRLKTLFDALSVPQLDQVVEDSSIADPIFCLLEDDGLITSASVDTHRLLSKPDASINEVKLIIEVDIGVTQSRLYNQAFLGD